MYYLSYLLAFFVIVFGIITFAAFVTFKKSKQTFKDYTKSKEGKGGIASAALGVFSIVALSLIIYLLPNNANASAFENGTWFNDAGVYIGLEYTKDQSPQCEDNSLDERGTSNLGLWGNVWQSRDETLRVNARYTHHSCFLGPDDANYDAGGVQLEWYLWKRKR